MSKVRRFAAILSLAGLLLADATPARAGRVAWNMAPCVSFDSIELTSTTYRSYRVLQGVVSQCGPVVADGGFRIATYSADTATGDAPGYNVRLFASAAVGAVREFGAAAVPMTPGEYGVCVLAGQNQRVGCYQVVVTGSGWRIYPHPLDPDAPLVNKDVVTSPYTGALKPPGEGKKSDPDPACGTCF